MLTTKQRAKLKGLANALDPVFQVGKGGIGDAMIKQINECLHVRELIKINVLENSSAEAKEVSLELAEKTQSEVVQVIGSKVVLYKRNKKNPIIELK